MAIIYPACNSIIQAARQQVATERPGGFAGGETSRGIRGQGRRMSEPRDLTSILDVLLAEQVSFVLVGALAAVAQGAPLMTQDVDIVHARTPEWS